jgi:pimeloyl-ACP methyl ester carboxylesterase
MGLRTATARKLALVVGAAAIALATLAASSAPAARVAASAPVAVSVRFQRLAGFVAPGTPAKYNRVGVLETGPTSAKNILVLVPGTSASAAYFEPLAKDIVRKTPNWQVWAVERRENLLEDHSVLNRAKQRKATSQQLFDYYLGWLSDKTITKHFQLIPDAQVAFARQWGMQVAVEDIRRVVQAAKRQGGRVVLGGHSLGGEITTAYATWDFNGQAGAKDLSGLVFDDGATDPTPISAQRATQSLQTLQTGSPWLAFGGITAPYAGLFNSVASTLVHNAPNEPAKLGSWPLLPANLKAPVPASNEGGYGYALDTKTSPMGLIAAQAHLGQLAATGDPRGWDPTGGLTPIQRFADMFSARGSWASTAPPGISPNG